MLRTPKSQRPRNSAVLTAARHQRSLILRPSRWPSWLTEGIRSILRNGWIKRTVRFPDYFSISEQTQSRVAMYSTLCNVKGDTTELFNSLQPQFGAATFYEINFEVVLALGLTELKAHICWKENVSSQSYQLDEI